MINLIPSKNIIELGLQNTPLSSCI